MDNNQLIDAARLSLLLDDETIQRIVRKFHSGEFMNSYQYAVIILHNPREEWRRLDVTKTKEALQQMLDVANGQQLYFVEEETRLICIYTDGIGAKGSFSKHYV